MHLRKTAGLRSTYRYIAHRCITDASLQQHGTEIDNNHISERFHNQWAFYTLPTTKTAHLADEVIRFGVIPIVPRRPAVGNGMQM
jgi:hypothetical protein